MGSFIKGTIFGTAVASAALVGFAYGDQASRSAEPEWDQRCDVDVGWGRPTYSDQCRWNDVMVGIRDDYILCAEIEVTCPDR